MDAQTLAYHNGIVEGRLMEHGFFGIGSPKFMCRTINSLYVITYLQHGDSTLEIFKSIPEQPEPEMEINEFEDWVRNHDCAFKILDIRGDIDDIIEVIKLTKPHYK